MLRLVLFVLTTVLQAGYSQGSKQWQKTVSRLSGEYPTLHNLFSAHIPQSPITFIDEDALERANFLLRFVPLPESSPLKDILNGVSLPAMHNDLSYEGIQHLLDQDPVKTSEMFRDYVSRIYERRSGMLVADRRYQECAKDYESFLAPVTNPLIRLLFDPCDQTEGSIPCYNDTLPDFTQYPAGRDMIDAMFKIPEALLEGKLHWPAAYEACFEIHADYEYTTSDKLTEQRQYNGQYSRLRLVFKALVERNITGLSLVLGVCVPMTCTQEHVRRYLVEDNLLTSFIIKDVLRMDITDVYQGKDNDVATDSLLKVVLTAVAFFGGLMVAASIYEYFFRKAVVLRDLVALARKHDRSMETDQKRQPRLRRLSSLASVSSVADLLYIGHSDLVDPPKYPITWLQRLEALFVSFSMYTNVRRIFSLKTQPHHLRVIDGVKVFMFGWFIIGQTAIFGIALTPVWTTQNFFAQFRRWPKLWFFQPVTNYSLVTDVFLCFSGMLVSYHWLRKLGKNTPSLTFCGKFLLNRVWSLWLPLALTLVFYVALSPYWPDGPFVPAQIRDAENCKESWWTTLLFVNNLVNVDKPCMIWTSQLALLVQFHVFSFIILIPLSMTWTIRRINVLPICSYVMMATTFLASFIAGVVITTNSFGFGGSWYKDYFLVPWCRICPYLIGMTAGIIIHSYKYKGFNPDIDSTVSRTVLMWLGHGIATVLVFFPIYISHAINIKDDYSWLNYKTQILAWHNSAPVSIALGVAWFTVCAEMGQQGIVSRILSGRWWLPYTRLMLQAYLVHVPILFGYFYLRKTTLYLKMYSLIYHAVANLIVAMAVGCIGALAWQYPLVISLKKVLCLKDVYSWMEYGRHPKQELAELKTVLSGRELPRGRLTFDLDEARESSAT